MPRTKSGAGLGSLGQKLFSRKIKNSGVKGSLNGALFSYENNKK